MRRLAVLGHPVAHSKSPWIHAEFARQTRQDLDYARIEAPLDGFERAVDEFRASGGSGGDLASQARMFCTMGTNS